MVDEGKSDYELALIAGVPMAGEEVKAKGDAELAELCRASASDPEFAKGFDNAAYEEIYRSVKDWPVGAKERTLFFAPALNPKTHEVSGVLVFAFDTEGERGFVRMMNMLFGAAL